MATSTVQVYRSDGSRATGVSVSLEFPGFGGGFTRSVYTNSSGKATVSHESTGSATVYVDGSSRGTMRAPGHTTVRL